MSLVEMKHHRNRLHDVPVTFCHRVPDGRQGIN